MLTKSLLKTGALFAVTALLAGCTFGRGPCRRDTTHRSFRERTNRRSDRSTPCPCRRSMGRMLAPTAGSRHLRTRRQKPTTAGVCA